MSTRLILGSSGLATRDWLNMEDANVNVNVAVDIDPKTAQAIATGVSLVAAIAGATLLVFAWMPGGMEVIASRVPGRGRKAAPEPEAAHPIVLGHVEPEQLAESSDDEES